MAQSPPQRQPRATPTRRQFLATVAAATGALVAACAAPSPAAPTGSGAATAGAGQQAAPAAAAAARPVSLRFATNYVGNSTMLAPTRGILQQFQQEFPNVSIDIEESPGNDHQTKIKLDASSDRLPDFFNYWRLDPVFGLDQIARVGQLADLTGWTKSDPAFQGLFDDSAWRTATLDGKVWGVPSLMFYVEFVANKDVLDRAGVTPPTTWDELLAAVKTLKAKGELPWGASIKGDSHGGRLYNQVFNRMLGNERALNMHAGKETYDVPECVAAAGLLKDLVVGNIPSDAAALDNMGVLAKYVNTGKAAFVLNGSFEIGNIKPEIQQKMVTLEFPLVPGGAQKDKNVEKDLTALWYASARSWADADKGPLVKELLKRLTSRAAGKRYAEEAQQNIAMQGVDIDAAKFGRMATETQAIALQRPQN